MNQLGVVMNKSLLFMLGAIVVSMLLIACNPDDNMYEPTPAHQVETATSEYLAKVGRGQIWADYILFGTVGTPTAFKPGAGPFDELFTGANFKDEVGAISESKPGDQDFNGGRWHVNVLKEGIDPAKYSSASSVDELDINDFEATTTYFECPLLPKKH